MLPTDGEIRRQVLHTPEHNSGIPTVEDVLRREIESPFALQLAHFEREQGKPFEQIPWKDKEPLILKRLDELVQIMRVNTTWRNRLDAAGVTKVNSWEDWHKVPLSTRSDVNALYTATKDGLVVPWNYPSDSNGHKVIASGGSTGQPILTVYRKSELRDVGERAGGFWRRTILGEGNGGVTMLNLLDNTNGWASSEITQNFLEGSGANTIPVGSITLPRVAEFFMSQGVTDIVGLPSNLSHLVDLLDQAQPGVTYPNVERAFYGGEFMDPIIRDKLLRSFPNIKIVAIYSSTQADHLAAQADPEGDILRLTDDVNLVEIVDDNGQPVLYGQPGRIVVTRLLGNGDQALRLDMQDQGAIELPDADDPLQARKLRLSGRLGDYLRVSTWDIRAADLLETSHQALQEVMSVDGIQSRQLVVDNAGVHLNLAVADASTMAQLPPTIQFQVMHDAIMKAVGFFEDPHDWPPSIQLSINFVTMDDLIRTQAGKIHPFVNQRK